MPFQAASLLHWGYLQERGLAWEDAVSWGPGGGCRHPETVWLPSELFRALDVLDEP